MTGKQLDLFGYDPESPESRKARFFTAVMRMASTMPSRFPFHQLRLRCEHQNIEAPHPNNWGQVSRKLYSMGYVPVEVGLSVMVSRRGGKECVWERVK